MTVRKRDGRDVPFDKQKIRNAVLAAFASVDGEESAYAKDKACDIARYIESLCKNLSVEEIQDIVEDKLMASNRKDVAKAYIKFRYDREKARILSNDLQERYKQIHNLISGDDEESNKENSNKDTRIIPTMRDYIAGFTCRKIANDIILPNDIKDAHESGIIHFHDTDYSPTMPMTNCCLINLGDMLQNGTVISEIMIEPPKSFRTACTVATQVITQVASSQYGGNTITLSHLAPFVDVSRKKIRKQVAENFAEYKSNFSANEYESAIEKIVEDRVREEIRDGIQTIQYQLITMSTTNGQSPFTTLFMYLDEVPDGRTRDDLAMIIEEVLRQRILGVKNTKGAYITTAFPKLIYCLDEDNIHENSKYWYLTKLAAECSAKRLVPDYISAKKMREYKEGNVFPNMGCRSFLSPWKDDNGDYKFYGRFNQGVVTISLPDVALSSKGNVDDFWKIFDERLDMCYRALMIRHNSLKGVKSDVAPILWQHGAYARLKQGETIDHLLYNGYSTISLGYAGLYECIKYMTGESQLEPNGYDLGIKIMQHMTDACERWKNETSIGFSVYGTPIESTTYKFAKALKKRFGIVPGITDKNYVTNSYHITPKQKIDAFSKLSIESKFQELSMGGSISYVETPNMTKNIDVILEIMKHIYETIMYAEINTTTSYCHVCGCTDIKMGDDLKFHCPNCGNDDFNKMNIALRICGYISTNPFNDGRAEDIHDRVYHVDDIECKECGVQ